MKMMTICRTNFICLFFRIRDLTDLCAIGLCFTILYDLHFLICWRCPDLWLTLRQH